jgi:hypothetical protein
MVFIAICAYMAAKAEAVQIRDSIQIAKIWDAGEHNAFTDLIRFKNRFYCSFREGAGHVSGDDNGGKVRILTSKDGKKWESAALLEVGGVDLRDPKLSVMPNNKIMVIMAGAVFDKQNVVEQLYPMVSFSDPSGKLFSTPEKSVVDPAIAPSRDWIWRVTWHKGIGYGINYQLKENARDRSSLKRDAWLVYLMRTVDGKYFEKVSRLNIPDLPNEATVRFDDKDSAYVLVRKEAGDKMGVLAKSGFPYNDWGYHDLDFRLGGPNFIFFDKNKLIIGTRLYETVTSTGILLADLNGNILKTIKLKGSGDASYPGMLIYKKKLWVSYYSSHEAKTSIYMAQIPLNQLEAL